MKLQLTKYPKLNLVILKAIEISLLCLVPFWLGRLSDWIYLQTSCNAFHPIGDTVFDTWFNGIFFICYLAGGVFLCFLIVTGVANTIKQNIKWAEKLTGEDEE